jgi:hypothetical protein
MNFKSFDKLSHIDKIVVITWANVVIFKRPLCADSVGSSATSCSSCAIQCCALHSFWWCRFVCDGSPATINQNLVEVDICCCVGGKRCQRDFLWEIFQMNFKIEVSFSFSLTSINFGWCRQLQQGKITCKGGSVVVRVDDDSFVSDQGLVRPCKGSIDVRSNAFNGTAKNTLIACFQTLEFSNSFKQVAEVKTHEACTKVPPHI